MNQVWQSIQARQAADDHDVGGVLSVNHSVQSLAQLKETFRQSPTFRGDYVNGLREANEEDHRVRLRIKPIRMLVILLVLITALAMSLTMLVNQAITYQRIKEHAVAREVSSNHDRDKRRTVTKNLHEKPQQTMKHPSEATKQDDNSQCINLNTAKQEELETLKGIGPKTAKRILQARSKLGRFLHLQDLLQIKGIGSKTLAKLRSHVCVN